MIGAGSVVAGLRAVLSGVVCVLAFAAVAAAPAAADTPPELLLNGNVASQQGSSDKYCADGMCVTLTDTSGTNSSGYPTENVSIESETPGAKVTGVLGQIPVSGWSGISQFGPCIELNRQVVGCLAMGQALMQNTLIVCRCPANSSGAVALASSNPRYVSKIDVGINRKPLSACDFDQAGARNFSRPVARAADACTPPSRTRITKTKITSNSASFRFTGRRAKHFRCVLYFNQRRVLNSSCRSPKHGSLPRGHYTFEVFGVNPAGFDPKPAKKSFTI